jgi:hypothetical protein
MRLFDVPTLTCASWMHPLEWNQGYQEASLLSLDGLESPRTRQARRPHQDFDSRYPTLPMYRLGSCTCAYVPWSDQTRPLGADDASNFEQYSDDVEGPGDKMGKIDRKDQVSAAPLQSHKLLANACAEIRSAFQEQHHLCVLTLFNPDPPPFDRQSSRDSIQWQSLLPHPPALPSAVSKSCNPRRPP